MDPDVNFDKISRTMCEHLVDYSSEIAEIIFIRTSGYFVAPPASQE